jgi:hypothetical protein
VDDLDHGLTRVQRTDDVRAQAAFLDGRGELLDDLEVDVGLEQRQPDLAHGLRDRFVVELAALAEVAECALKPV